MNGIFGTQALLQTDLNLLVQIIAVALLMVGYAFKKRGKIKRHAGVMGLATFLHAGSFLAVMGPVFLSSLIFISTDLSSPSVISLMVHVVAGAVSLALALYLVFSWGTRVSNIDPCYRRKRVMDGTIVLWIISATMGTATYILAYM